jgi:hypothetical protein
MKDQDLEKAQELLDEKMISLQEKAKDEDYQAVELRLTDSDGNVLIKGAMKVADLMALEESHTLSKGDVIKMFYAALEDDLKNKLENEK